MGFFWIFGAASRGTVVRVACCAGMVVGSVGISVAQNAHRSPWNRAVQARADFEEQPVGTHTKAEFGRVMDGFRTVYHDAPRDGHAAEAVKIVAELLAEQGRELHDPASLRNAVGQYEFLRTQYPGSALRLTALLAEGEIEQRDLQDTLTAREKYKALIKEAPKSGAAEEARTELAELQAGQSTITGHGAADTPLEARRAKPETAGQGLALTEENARAVESAQTTPAGVTAATRDRSPDQRSEGVDDQSHPLSAVVPDAAPARDLAAERVAAATPTIRLATVTGIRHWSTATYTRVAIDLGDAVTFQAARVPNPDRIYFDLHGAKLGAELVGKSFSVTDDGFLKKIRAAQSSPDMTRVVLDVNDVTDYSAFLLPNPYRLIIDIHGSKGATAGEPNAVAAVPVIETPAVPVAAGDSVRASVAADSSGLPAMGVTDGGDAVRSAVTGDASAKQNGRALPDSHPGSGTGAAKMGRLASGGESASGRVPAPIVRPVPGAVAVKAPAATMEVAAVSEAPGRVDATNEPTSKPIAATVLGVPAPASATLGAGSATGASRRKKTRGADAAIAADAAPAKAADKTADGETSLVRALGLKINRIVIDAGHGGHDSGTLGAGGIEEKDVVLDVALRLGKLLHDRLGAEIIYTRSDDTFIPLETRTAIANKAQADLFISVHANSSEDTSARGVETYYLNFTSDPAALDVAARENAVGGQSIHQLSDLVKKITLKDKIDESREFAADVETSLYAGLARGNAGLKDRGVKKAPFVVLIGANMPSILAEISFVTNPKDADQLRQPEYRERVAESLYNGVAKYENGLAGSQSTLQRAAIR